MLGKNVPDDRFDEQGDTLGEDKFMAAQGVTRACRARFSKQMATLRNAARLFI